MMLRTMPSNISWAMFFRLASVVEEEAMVKREAGGFDVSVDLLVDLDCRMPLAEGELVPRRAYTREPV